MGLWNTVTFLLRHPLNRRRKLAAFLDFARWQVGSRLVPGAVAYKWIGDARLLACPGEKGVTGNIYAGLHEFAEMAFVLHALRPGELFVDIGANSGSFSILAACVADAEVIAFEPDSEAYKRLCANVRLNNVTATVYCHNTAVGSGSGSLAFTANGDTVNHVVTDDRQRQDLVVVPATTLDVALAGREPKILKIDVEGYELEVLRGGQNTLVGSSLFAVMMETNGSGQRYGIQDDSVKDYMRNFGFEECCYDPLTRTLAKAAPGRIQSNTIFIRNPDQVATRVKHGRTFVIKNQVV